MAETELRNIFLSASIPLSERDPKYFGSADIIAIRDAVTALTEVVLPQYHLVWGGHPSITPLVYQVILKRGQNSKELIRQHVTLYQSRFFEKYFPIDNNKFENVRLIESTGERESSLLRMREHMFRFGSFEAGVFIGGMEGVEIEFDLFKELHPNAKLFPIASTGAAAKKIFERFDFDDDRLIADYSYSSLFNDLLSKY